MSTIDTKTGTMPSTIRLEGIRILERELRCSNTDHTPTEIAGRYLLDRDDITLAALRVYGSIRSSNIGLSDKLRRDFTLDTLSMAVLARTTIRVDLLEELTLNEHEFVRGEAQNSLDILKFIRRSCR